LCSSATPSASGSSIILDLGDDGGNDSVALGEIAVTNDTNAIFSEPSADKLLIDLSKDWPKADTADALAAEQPPLGHERGDVDHGTGVLVVDRRSDLLVGREPAQVEGR